jgi:hypothetical protein
MLFRSQLLPSSHGMCIDAARRHRGARAAAEVFASPEHPYTKRLLDSIPGRRWLPPVA